MLRFGQFEFDLRRQELRRNGHRVVLSASQLRLLKLFLERPGELITRDNVAACLWTDTGTIDVATGINTAINRLRRHLQDSPGAPSCVETVIGLGYRFLPELQEVGDAEIDLKPAFELLQEEEFGADPPPSAPGESLLERIPSKEEETSRAETLEQQHPQHDLASVSPMLLTHGRLKPWMSMVLVCSLLLVVTLASYSSHRGFAFAPSKHLPAVPLPALGPLLRVTADVDLGTLTASAVAPSGRSLAYANRFGVSAHWFANGAERLLGVRPSFTVDRLSWLPDENGLLMSGTDEESQRKQVWHVPVQGAYLSLIADDADRAVVSPDGGQILFTRSQDQELWLAEADGEHPRRLQVAPAGRRFDLTLWSPAGDRVMLTLRKGEPGDSAWGEAPASQGMYECMDSNSGRLLHQEEGFSAQSGYLLADGRFFYVANNTPGPTTGAAELMMVPLNLSSGAFRGAPARVRSFDARAATSLTASSSGAPIAAVLNRVTTDVYVADLRPGPVFSHVIRLTDGARQNYPHAWTVGDRGILLESNAPTQRGSTEWSVYEQPLDGSKARLLASLPGGAAMPQLSPDGRWILFLQFAGRPQRAVGVFRVPANGGPVEQVPTHGDIEEFHCSNSAIGRCVLRETIANQQLVYYSLDPVQGMGQELKRTPWKPNRLGDWGISADGFTVATADHDALHPGVEVISLRSKPSEIQEISIAGHGTTLGANWALDGKSLFVESKTDTGVQLMNLDLTGHAKVLRVSPSLIWAVLSHDGRKNRIPKSYDEQQSMGVGYCTMRILRNQGL